MKLQAYIKSLVLSAASLS